MDGNASEAITADGTLARVQPYSQIEPECSGGRTPYTERTIGIDHPYSSQPAFSRDGKTLFTPVVDGSIATWDLRPASWVEAACKLVNRNLTEAEWRQHVGDQRYHKTCER